VNVARTPHAATNNAAARGRIRASSVAVVGCTERPAMLFPIRISQPALRPVALTLVAAALFSACGGGGSDAGTDPFGNEGGGSGSGLPASSTLAQQCAATNTLAPAASRTATLDRERRWVRSYVDEAYLWYREIPSVNTADANFNLADVPTSLDNYFEALKSPQRTTSGKLKDEFSFTYPTVAWEQLSQSGIVAGFGAEWILGSPTPPRNVRVAYVDPATPAATAAVARGWRVVSVNNVSIDDPTAAGVAVINEGVFSPRTGQPYNFVFEDTLGAQRAVTMTAGQITKTPVQNVRTISTPSGNVGYMTFNDHILPAEGQLVGAFTQLASLGVNDLVLDLRYNGGGYLYIASEIGYMVAGSARTASKTFEKLQFNDKRAAETASADNNTPFYNVASGEANTGTTANAALPTLNLNRVYVLASPGTCSASEAIVNGLRGVGVEVVLVGGTTCGKPYGFYGKDNCGITYFPIEFKGVNQLGFGDYADGFAPTATCTVADDFSRALGDSSEGMLAAALNHRATGSCGGTATGREAPQAAGGVAFGRVIRHPVRESKFRR
jgi:carboxyl-terminal processing protease